MKISNIDILSDEDDGTGKLFPKKSFLSECAFFFV